MAEISFEVLHEDFTRAILSRLPLKSLGKCICASEKLASIIRTKEFKDLYLHQSMTRPRMLFIDYARNVNANNDYLLFYSVYQEEKPLLSSGQQESHTFLDLRCKIAQPIRGLICVREKTKIMICNPTTRKSWTLPELKTCKEALIDDYFGYDEVKDEFKVLCLMQMKSDVKVGYDEAKEYKVLTVGSEEKPWIPIACEHYHTPVSSQGLCKGGVLYYGAKSNSNESMVMSFNLRSEKFNDIKLPEEINIRCSWWKFVNYNGEIALVDENDHELHENGVLQIWVRKEIEEKKEKEIEEKTNKEIEEKCEWKKTQIVIPRDRWIAAVERKRFYFKGTIGTGELVFAQRYLDKGQMGSLMVLYYDEVTQNLRKLKPEREFEAVFVQTLLDHVDSPQLM